MKFVDPFIQNYLLTVQYSVQVLQLMDTQELNLIPTDYNHLARQNTAAEAICGKT